MIIGNGDIGSVLPKDSDLLLFASGVSNSSETRESEYKRERDLLLEQRTDHHIVYFSSLAIFYSDTRYTRHKLDMEAMIKENFPKYCIVRLGNITWGTNPNTIINYFRLQLENHHPLQIRDEYRYIIDKDEFLHWVGLIPDWNCEMNITGKRLKIKEIIDEYCYVGLPS